jgi:hypothetical protein
LGVVYIPNWVCPLYLIVVSYIYGDIVPLSECNLENPILTMGVDNPVGLYIKSLRELGQKPIYSSTPLTVGVMVIFIFTDIISPAII